MWIENEIFKTDMEYIASAEFIPWYKLRNKTIFITGGTGLIGYYTISALLYKNITSNYNIRVIALVRNMEKAKQMYSAQLLQSDNLLFYEGTLEQLPIISEHIDYIIHGASPTKSSYFVTHPVETIDSIILGSRNILLLAQKKAISGMVYLSSMEVYGENNSNDKLYECSLSQLNSNKVRNCYPISKMAVELMNLAYFHEYQVPINSLRISQTIGCFRKEKEKKIIEEIIDCVFNNKDIVLLTKGESKRTYIYIRDVVTAILVVLLQDQHGEIYNVSNEVSYMSIYEMAKLVAENIANNEIHVNVENKKINKFPETNCLNLSSRKLCQLGWEPSVNLEMMFRLAIRSCAIESDLDLTHL